MKQDETPIEFLRRAISNLDNEQDWLLQDLPSAQAVVDYFKLWDIYGTDLMVGIEEAIEEGADPNPLQDFVKKYELDWNLAWIPKKPIQSDLSDELALIKFTDGDVEA